MLNLALLLTVTLVFGQFHGLAEAYFPHVDLTHVQGIASTKPVKPFAPFMILIVVPFIVSRLVLKFVPPLVYVVAKHQPNISKITMFGIVFYLFSLKTSQLLFQVSATDLLKASIATAAFYAVTFAAAIYLTDRTPTGKAVFWHIATRYITLALILAVFNVGTFGPTFILPVMIAYFIQIGTAGFLARLES
jgi:predicted Na+-dependent transporter